MGGGNACSLTSPLSPRKPETRNDQFGLIDEVRLDPLEERRGAGARSPDSSLRVLVWVKVAGLGQYSVGVESDPLAGFSDLFNRHGSFSAFAAWVEVIAF